MMEIIILLRNGKKILVYKTIGYEYRLYLPLNFPRAANLNFYDDIRLPNHCIQKKTLIPNNSGNK